MNLSFSWSEVRNAIQCKSRPVTQGKKLIFQASTGEFIFNLTAVHMYNSAL